MRWTSLVLMVVTVTTLGVGCTYERPTPRVIKPSYSYRHADATTASEGVPPAQARRTARAGVDWER
ncbi:MAG: hypothetical protein ACODAQ_01085 [Phycisphaeraceae bacterium]